MTMFSISTAVHVTFLTLTIMAVAIGPFDNAGCTPGMMVTVSSTGDLKHREKNNKA